MKRGGSQISLVVGIDKPLGMTSHDVVSRVRRIFNEKRVGHAGTLDPAATGVLAVCVGSAARLCELLTAHDKCYDARIVFGCATDTDDAQGALTDSGDSIPELYDEAFACDTLEGLLGASMQLPPVYSALKVGGKKACDEARRGNVLKVQPRRIEVFSAELLGITEVREELIAPDGAPCAFEGVAWDVALRVSKGTYIRSIARDLGERIGSFAHVGALRRTRSGSLSLARCCSLDALERMKETAALDPVRLLGYRFCFVRGEQAKVVENGGALRAADVELLRYNHDLAHADLCSCTSGVVEACEPPHPDEIICVIAENRLVALYRFDAATRLFKPFKVFQGGVSRGLS